MTLLGCGVPQWCHSHPPTPQALTPPQSLESVGVAQSVPTAARAVSLSYFHPLSLIFKTPDSSVQQKLFCPTHLPLFLSMSVFPYPLPRFCVFSPCLRCLLSMSTLVFVWISPSLQPPWLLSFLSAVFWFPFLNCSPRSA